MIYHVDSAGNRYLSGFMLSALGIGFLIAGFLYRGSWRSESADPVAGPMLEGLSWLFVLLPVALIAMGMFMIVRAYRLAPKAPREPGGTVDRHDR